MGYSQPILGHVATVTRGIGVSDAAAGAQGLPNVDPVYTWVTLAQRVPVRIAIDRVPPGIPLVSGMTATVTVKDASSRDGRTWLARAISAVETRLSDVMSGPPARPGCIPATTTERATTDPFQRTRRNRLPLRSSWIRGSRRAWARRPKSIDGSNSPDHQVLNTPAAQAARSSAPAAISFHFRQGRSGAASNRF